MPDTNDIKIVAKELEKSTKEKFSNLTDIKKYFYLQEMSKLAKSFDDYFNKSKDYTKSRMNYAFATWALYCYDKEKISFDNSKLSDLLKAKEIIEKDLNGDNKIPYVNGTDNCIDALKGLDIGIKYGVVPPSILKEELNKWHDITIKNVDFQKVENAIESKELLSSINFTNCKFINCNVENLKHLSFSNETNQFMIDNTVEPKKGRTAKAPDFSIKFTKPKDRNWNYPIGSYTKILNPDIVHSGLGDKLRLDVPSPEGTQRWFFPKDWVRPSRNGVFLVIPKDIKLGDIIYKKPNLEKPLHASARDLNACIVKTSHRDKRDYNGYEFYNKLMEEPTQVKVDKLKNSVENFMDKVSDNTLTLSPKGFLKFKQEQKGKNSALKPKKDTKPQTLNLDNEKS